MTAKQWKSP